uniref:Uncharacterized protein n=1 Tax=Oryzias sinensis TaxID=183150 RepID=A0A8C7ZGZ1_9TELE
SCTAASLTVRKAFSQCPQGNGRSPVWMRLCLVSAYGLPFTSEGADSPARGTFCDGRSELSGWERNSRRAGRRMK